MGYMFYQPVLMMATLLINSEVLNEIRRSSLKNDGEKSLYMVAILYSPHMLHENCFMKFWKVIEKSVDLVFHISYFAKFQESSLYMTKGNILVNL